MRIIMAASLDYYKVFYYTAKIGNITQAAAALYLTQPTVSHTIKLLEQELGCPLFLRSQKGVTMTPEAQKLYAHIAAAYEHIEKGEAELKAARNFQTGELRIGASETTLRQFLLPRLTAFKQAYPAIRLKIYNTTTPGALQDLSKQLLDLAVLVTPMGYRSDRFSSARLTGIKDAFIAGNRYDSLKDHPVSLKELTCYPLISMTPNTLTRDSLEQLFSAHHLSIKPDIELSSADLIPPLVRDNLGIGFVPLPLARAAIEEGSVFELSVPEPLPEREIRLFYDRALPLSLPAKAFAQMLE